MTKNTKYKTLYEYIGIMVGVIILSLSINIFLEPHALVTGGATGLGIIFQSFSESNFGFTVPLWVTNLVINTPLLLLAAKINGAKFIKKTLFATLFLSLGLFLTAFIPLDKLKSDLFLAAVFGGTASGLGVGIVFRNFATTGGSDLGASILHHYLKHVPISKIMFLIDAVIIALGFFIFGSEKTMYAIISVFIGSKMIEAVMEGLSFAKAAFIISDKAEEISRLLLESMERGATCLHGKGMYTGNTKNVLLCVVSTKEIVKLKELVAAADRQAFVIVADVREVLGEGFQPI